MKQSESATPLQINSRVEVLGTEGFVRFIGGTSFATGTWVGVELCEQLGKNDGSVQGTRYFQCQPNFGVFVRVSQVKVVREPQDESSPVPLSSTVANQTGSSQNELFSASRSMRQVSTIPTSNNTQLVSLSLSIYIIVISNTSPNWMIR